MARSDPRIFRPDATCLPFQLEAQIGLPVEASFIMGRFRVPTGRVAVIASFSSYEAVGLDTRRICYIIVRGDPTIDVANPESSHEGEIAPEGSLVNVEEFAGILNESAHGWGQFFSLAAGPVTPAIARPCRVVIDGESNILTLLRTHNVATTAFTCRFSGWHFNPLEPVQTLPRSVCPGYDLIYASGI
jgi:hypothetical protein